MVEIMGEGGGGSGGGGGGVAGSPGAMLIEVLDLLRDGREVFFKYIRTVGDVMDASYEPLTIDSKIKDAWDRMAADGLADLPVCDVEEPAERGGVGRKVSIGTIRSRDLCVVLSPFVGGISQSATDDKVLKESLGSYIARGLPTLTAEAPLSDGLELLLKSGLETIAVVGPNSTYLGALTIVGMMRCFARLDVLRRGRTQDEGAGETRLFDILGDRNRPQPTDMMLGTFLGSVKDVMDKKAHGLRSDDRVEDAIRLMEDKKVEFLVVVDGRSGGLQGIVSESAVQLALPPIIETGGPKASAKGLRYNREDKDTRLVLQARIGSVMQARPPTVAPQDPVAKAADMLSRSDDVLAVADSPHARPSGLVSRRDLLRVLSALNELAAKRGG